MTVAGRRPPSRWSWRSAFGAATMVARSGTDPMVPRGPGRGTARASVRARLA